MTSDNLERVLHAIGSDMTIPGLCALLPSLRRTITAESILPYLWKEETYCRYICDTLWKNKVMEKVTKKVINGKVPHLVDMPGCSKYIFNSCMGLERLSSVSGIGVRYGVELWDVADIGPNVAILSDMNNMGAFLLVCSVMLAKMNVPAEKAEALLAQCVRLCMAVHSRGFVSGSCLFFLDIFRGVLLKLHSSSTCSCTGFHLHCTIHF